LCMGVADVGRALLAREQARSAADAAALAAVSELAFPLGADPTQLAREYAARNGGELSACACAPGSTEATVTVRVAIPGFLLFPGGSAVSIQARAVTG
ncbi:MAG: pilus assembly protein TadG-related protein, partial [Actinomycetota bacterium]